MTNDDIDDVMAHITQKMQEVLDAIQKIKISAITMNRLIETSLGVMGKARLDSQYNDAIKYIRKTFNIMYRTNKGVFLQNFKKGN